MVYTAFGLAAFPIMLLRPMSGPPNKADPKHLQIELRKITADLDMLVTKYRGREEWPARDKAKRNALQRKKRALERKNSSASNANVDDGDSDSCCSKISRCFWTTA